MKIYVLSVLASLVTGSTAYAGDSIWACNFSDGSTAVFVQDGRKAAGTLRVGDVTLSIKSTREELLEASREDWQTPVTFTQVNGAIEFRNATQLVLKVDTALKYDNGKTVYPWTGNYLPDAEMSLVGGCWGF